MPKINILGGKLQMLELSPFVPVKLHRKYTVSCVGLQAYEVCGTIELQNKCGAFWRYITGMVSGSAIQLQELYDQKLREKPYILFQTHTKINGVQLQLLEFQLIWK